MLLVAVLSTTKNINQFLMLMMKTYPSEVFCFIGMYKMSPHFLCDELYKKNLVMYSDKCGTHE